MFLFRPNKVKQKLKLFGGVQPYSLNKFMILEVAKVDLNFYKVTFIFDCKIFTPDYIGLFKASILTNDRRYISYRDIGLWSDNKRIKNDLLLHLFKR